MRSCFLTFIGAGKKLSVRVKRWDDPRNEKVTRVARGGRALERTATSR